MDERVKPKHEWHGDHEASWLVTSCGQPDHDKWWSCAVCGERPKVS